MTFSKPSDPNSNPSPETVVSSMLSDEVCKTCSGPMRLRNARPFPVLLQSVFGISFVAFLIIQSQHLLSAKLLWIWSVFQVAVGVLLVRARYAAAKKVFICLRCGATLP